jgi:transposase
MRREELTDEQWAVVSPLIPTPQRRAGQRGRPMRESREVLAGALWVLRHSAPWHELPQTFPSYQTCHRRFQQWVSDGTLRLVLEALERDLRDRSGLEASDWLTLYTSADAEGAEDEQASAWQQQTAMLFLSRATLRLLHRLKSPLARRLSLRYLPQAKSFASQGRTDRDP